MAIDSLTSTIGGQWTQVAQFDAIESFDHIEPETLDPPEKGLLGGSSALSSGLGGDREIGSFGIGFGGGSEFSTLPEIPASPRPGSYDTYVDPRDDN